MRRSSWTIICNTDYDTRGTLLGSLLSGNPTIRGPILGAPLWSVAVGVVGAVMGGGGGRRRRWRWRCCCSRRSFCVSGQRMTGSQLRADFEPACRPFGARLDTFPRPIPHPVCSRSAWSFWLGNNPTMMITFDSCAGPAHQHGNPATFHDTFPHPCQKCQPEH